MKTFKKIIKFFKLILPDPNPYIPEKKCEHSMVVEQYIDTDQMAQSSKKCSREICETCKWVDYNSYWTWHENPMTNL